MILFCFLSLSIEINATTDSQAGLPARQAAEFIGFSQ
jgi:hypothetical protein